MRIRLEGVGKRFHKEWIFRNVNLQFENGSKYAIVGNNGSGKSTLLQLISSIGVPTEGAIVYEKDAKELPLEDTIGLFAFAAPYQELPEELTGYELFALHYKFRNRSFSFDPAKFFQLVQLDKQGDKLVKFYSSGMKQRLRLGLCMLTESDVYMLDEPTTNLDKNGMQWYQRMLTEHLQNKMVFISSNIEEEYAFCDTIINIADYKLK